MEGWHEPYDWKQEAVFWEPDEQETIEFIYEGSTWVTTLQDICGLKVTGREDIR